MQFRALVRHKKLSMETSSKTTADAAVLRSELPASPDAGLNETLHLNLTADDVVGFIAAADEESLEFVQERAELEQHSRSPEGRGEDMFRKAFRAARKVYRADVAAATELLETAEAAVIAFFDTRDADITVGDVVVRADGKPTIVTVQMVVRDRQLGRLRIQVQGYYGYCQSAGIIVRNRWGTTILSTDSVSGGSAPTIAEFAYWAARQ